MKFITLKEFIDQTFQEESKINLTQFKFTCSQLFPYEFDEQEFYDIIADKLESANFRR